MRQTKQIRIYKTDFAFRGPNFSGDPNRNKFGNNIRCAALYVPDEEKVKELIKAGVTVNETKPGRYDDPETFEPQSFVNITLAYRNRLGVPLREAPKVYLKSGDNPLVLLDEETVGEGVDGIRIAPGGVDGVFDIVESRNNPGHFSLYVHSMCVRQDVESDPFAEEYARGRAGAHAAEEDDDLPF